MQCHARVIACRRHRKPTVASASKIEGLQNAMIAITLGDLTKWRSGQIPTQFRRCQLLLQLVLLRICAGRFVPATESFILFECVNAVPKMSTPEMWYNSLPRISRAYFVGTSQLVLVLVLVLVCWWWWWYAVVNNSGCCDVQWRVLRRF